MPNGFLTTENILDTDTQLLGYPETVYYSGASGIYVDNVNNIISITGDVGKEYNGIEPIVVNNEENLISANSAPIGVQEPLYFVQDDDEAVIIGFSGRQGDPEVNTLVHTNSAAWNESTYITQTNSSVWGDVTGKQDILSFHYLEI